MAINTLEMAKIFQQALDKQMLVGATSGWMEANAQNVKYNGGDTVRMPEISVGGLAKYDRDNGFNQGAVTLEYKDYKLTQDRGRTFHLDAMDVDESNFVASAGNVMGEFQRLQVIPEIDAFRYSKIASLAKGATHETATFTPTKDNILEALDAEITKIQDIVGDAEPLVIMMSTPARTILNGAKNITKFLDTTAFKAGVIDTKVKTYNEIPLFSVPSARMKTAYVFNDGKTAGQEAGGFKADTTAKNINWIIIARRAPIAISKTDKTRIFMPDINQKADAWKLDYRKFHDLWIPSNKLAGVWVNTGA
nr:MAG TPA: major capsid protein [Caudoviricetes sp.]